MPTNPTQKSTQKSNSGRDAITRKPLLTAILSQHKNVDHIEIKQIDFTPHQETGRHFHPCPVVGLVTKGTILFQPESQPLQIFHPGDAFYEPANAVIERFDAGAEPASFVCFYLLGPNESQLIEHL